MATLILIRHAKSDWSAGVSDLARPLNSRGRRQAPATGDWVAGEFDEISLAVVSIATRAQQTWELVSAHLDPMPDVINSEAAYTFDGDDLAEIVAGLPTSAETVILVGHNPALEELIRMATGRWAEMPTSAVAVLEIDAWTNITDGAATLLAAGRPADGRWIAR
ncbi:MAG: histidine phosphatase family protein [Propionibacteriaceae bacterium]|nr:histidine phosphatase family protein [Propionibacteriaceae bacterium]